MIRIRSVQLREIRLPLREPFRISSGIVAERRILLLLLTDADGVASWAECVAGEQPNYSAETIDTAWLAIRAWPRLLAARTRRAADGTRTTHTRSPTHRISPASTSSIC